MRGIWTIALPLLMLAGGALPAADWPREIRDGDRTVLVYEPQVDSLDGRDARARLAVAIRRDADREPEFGALWVRATLDAARDDAPARIGRLAVDRTRFPEASAAEVAALTSLVERAAPGWELGRTLADIRVALDDGNGVSGPDFRNDPPEILFRDRPAILVTLDGAPQLRPIPDTPYQRVVNTAFPIVYDPGSREYWLYGSELWFSTRQLVGGTWSPREQAPATMAALFADPDAEYPVDAGEAVSPEQLRRAEIIVVTEPSELVTVDGEPRFSPLVGDDLLYVTNTDSDLFLEVPTRQYYVVLGGRWYRSRSLSGPWAWVDPAVVPAAFAAVPGRSEKSAVRAYVPGTDEADDALLDAMIPRTSTVQRGTGDLEVTWDGTPIFDVIPGTALAYARNTPVQMLRYQDLYYVVDEGIWYVSGSPYGPWEVATSRPGDLDRIPASSPAYNTRYVYIYDYTPEVVYVGYTPGYTWAFPYRGTVVYGTGYRYRPWIGPVAYYPTPWTWGFSARYDPWWGWGHGIGWSAGWASFSYAWGPSWGYYPAPVYRPPYRGGYRAGYRKGYWDGLHTRGWFGPGGYRPPRYAKPPPRRRYDVRPPDHRYVDRYVDRGRGDGRHRSNRPLPGDNLYRRPDHRGPVIDRRSVDRRDGRNQSDRNQRNRRPPENNVVVDRHGNPYRRTPDGWQARDRQGWQSARPPGEAGRADRPDRPRGTNLSGTEQVRRTDRARPTDSRRQAVVPRSPERPRELATERRREAPRQLESLRRAEPSRRVEMARSVPPRVAPEASRTPPVRSSDARPAARPPAVRTPQPQPRSERSQPRQADIRREARPEVRQPEVRRPEVRREVRPEVPRQEVQRVRQREAERRPPPSYAGDGSGRGRERQREREPEGRPRR